jgi:hypothetical protein
MNLKSLGVGTPRTVVVLGAGASRGASFVGTVGVLPPLDADFFEQARRLPPKVQTAEGRSLLHFLHETRGVGADPTLETFFTEMSAVDRLHTDFKYTAGKPLQRYQKQLDYLRQLIPRVFSEAFKGGKTVCGWHDRIASALRTNDAVLSFNYDCLIDGALARVAGGKWRADEGYGFRVHEGADKWQAPTGRGGPVKYPILLLKPHGSLNWRIDYEGNKKPRAALISPYDDAATYSVIPPTWDKTEVTDWPWHEVWCKTRKVLHEAQAIVVVGYSLPVTDHLAQALFRADATNLRTLVVVNPDEEVKDRFRSLVARPLSRRGARVIGSRISRSSLRTWTRRLRSVNRGESPAKGQRDWRRRASRKGLEG